MKDNIVEWIRRQLFYGSRVAIEEGGTQEVREKRAPSGALLFDGVRRLEMGRVLVCSAVADGRGALRGFVQVPVVQREGHRIARRGPAPSADAAHLDRGEVFIITRATIFTAVHRAAKTIRVGGAAVLVGARSPTTCAVGTVHGTGDEE